LAEAPSFGQSIFQYAPDSNGAADYRELAEELMQMPAARQLLKSA
jgi:chromosome partitioning protein